MREFITGRHVDADSILSIHIASYYWQACASSQDYLLALELLEVSRLSIPFDIRLKFHLFIFFSYVTL